MRALEEKLPDHQIFFLSVEQEQQHLTAKPTVVLSEVHPS